MPNRPNRPGYQALRKGRISVPGARYFLTLALDQRQKGLATDNLFAAMISALETVPGDTFALVAMPDHLHWLVRLADDGELPQLLRSFKGPLSVRLRAQGLKWQKGAYHDRRLRADDEIAPFLRYMLCNPYRAGLCDMDQTWPYWYRSPEVGAWFDPTTRGGRPFPEWIRDSRNPPWEEGIEG